MTGMMPTGSYTPGWDRTAVAFMARRRLHSHAPELLPLLQPGRHVADVGCGPAVMSREIAARVAPGPVVAIDVMIDQVDRTTLPENLRVAAGRAEALPLEDASVDVVLAHALLEHLTHPVAALREFARVLRPGGRVVVVSPDWGGFVLAPDSPELAEAIAACIERIASAGGHPRAGRKLGEWLREAGFEDPSLRARYECYDDAGTIAEYLAHQLDGAADEAARVLRQWATQPGALFAQCWISATASRAA